MSNNFEKERARMNFAAYRSGKNNNNDRTEVCSFKTCGTATGDNVKFK